MGYLVVGVVVGLGFGLVLGWLAGGRRTLAQLHDAQVQAQATQARLDALSLSDAERAGALAAEALAHSSDRLAAQFAAEQRSAAGQHAARDTALRDLLEPLSRTLDDVRRTLSTTEQARAEGQALLGAQVRTMREEASGLRYETAQLVTALRGSQVRGRWGEVQLRRVVEAAGMLDRVDFAEQRTTRTDDGSLRPDMVVRLAGGKHVVVDAKAPFLGFLAAAQADDPDERAAGYAAHARQVRAHVDALAAKQYWEQFSPAPEFVVMFVPVESFWSVALEADPGLVEHAFDSRVVVTTPVTLLALLRTVAYAWRQDALADNAQAVLDLGRQLHGRLATMGTHLGRLGRALESATTTYNQTVASWDTRVLVSARRLRDLGVTDEDLPTPATVDPRLSRVAAQTDALPVPAPLTWADNGLPT
ncbi:MAG: DNA recombination protein RmuC [Micrococcales bacterium]|nr:DNA recombination protein RmuC [Micrococcales bacterium]MCL2666212.1 DNA recombination protein RmuC [Micrococcales bacterium]